MPYRRALAACLTAFALAGATPTLAATKHRATSTATTESTATVVFKGSASARTLSSATTATNPETPIPVPDSNTPPAGRHLSADQVLEIADALPKMRAVRAHFRGSYGDPYLKGLGRWQVSYFSRQSKEIGQVIIADRDGRVLEQWTGFQIAWSMARGYPGAFGRHVNALYIWIPLCVLFFVPFFDWRKPLRLLHLDLLVLLSFSVSLAFFNHAHIYASTPLVYPPLVYLLARMLALARIGRRPRGPETSGSEAEPHTHNSLADLARPNGVGTLPPPLTPGPGVGTLPPPLAPRPGVGALPPRLTPRPGVGTLPPPLAPRPGVGALPPRLTPRPGVPTKPLRLLVPTPYLAVGVVFLLGFRIALNVTDSNVIDVGYAGVIGAQRIATGQPLYGGWPAENEHGDTYGPVNYETYLPFQQTLGWSGHWDELPAAHGAAILFDLLAVGLLFLLGRRARGPGLGVALAYAWVSYPFTLYALESNSNDSLVAVFVLGALLVATSPPARGAFAALAGLAKFAPLALAPLLCTHGLGGLSPWRRARAVSLFALAFLLTAALVSIPALAHDSLHTIFERTLAYQDNRESPFSIWGLYRGSPPSAVPALEYAQAAVQGAALALAVALAFLPRRADTVGLAAAAAAVLIAVQLGIDHWFYLYIPWFFAVAIFALLGQFSWPGSSDRVAPSESARSSQLAAA